MAILTLDEAKTHLRETTTDHDADITAKLEEAEATIRGYLKSQNDPAWDGTTAPREVRASIKLYLSNLMRQRGDVIEDEDAKCWQAIERLLVRLRDPAVA